MFNINNALYKAKTKIICSDSYNNGAKDGTIVIGYLYHDIGAYFIKAFDTDHADYISYEIDPDTVGVFTGKILDDDTLDSSSETKIFVNDIIFNTHLNTKAVVIYDEDYYRFAVKTENNEIIAFNDWDWNHTCVLGYKPPTEIKEFHLWLNTDYNPMHTIHTYDDVQDNLFIGTPIIHTTQIICVKTSLFSLGYRIFVHDKDFSTFEITLGKCERTNRLIRNCHSLSQLIINGEFDLKT